LFFRVIERIEGMEQLFLRLDFLLQKMDIVDEQHVGVSILVLKIGRFVVLDRLDELVGKVLGGNVDDLAALFLPREVSDRLHEVGLSESDASVDEAGVIRRSGVFRDRQGGVRREGVVFPNDEIVKGIVFPKERVLIPFFLLAGA
jgi:hypothetical protein